MNETQKKLVLCPYCGNTQANTERCEDCGGHFDLLNRKSTQLKMGPWFIRDLSHPFRPGISYELLCQQAKQGNIKSSTVIRGPSTHQFWALARNVPGIAHLLGYCHRCGCRCNPNRDACPDCSEPFRAFEERNELGLMYRSPAAIAAARHNLERELTHLADPSAQQAPTDTGPAAVADPGDSGPLEFVPTESSDATGSAGDTIALKVDPDSDPLLDDLFAPETPSSSWLKSSSTIVPVPPRTADQPSFTGSAGYAPPSTTPTAPVEPAGAAAVAVAPAPPQKSKQARIEEEIQSIKQLNASSNRMSLMLWLLLAVNMVTLGLWIPSLLDSKSTPSTSAASSFQGNQHPTQTATSSSPPTINGLPTGSSAKLPQAPTPSVDQMLPPISELSKLHSTPKPLTQAPTSITSSPVATQLAQANNFIKEGKPKEALALLESIAKSLPPEDRPTGLDQYIKQLEEQVAHVEAATFFGIPVD